MSTHKGFEALREFPLTSPDDSENKNLVFPGFQIGLENDPVAVVIDGNNLGECCRLIERDLPELLNGSKYYIDYKKLANVLDINFPNIKRKYYLTSEKLQRKSGENQGTGHSKIRGMLDWLKYNRYVVITKPIDIEVSDNGNVEQVGYERSYENIMDVEITTALFRAAEVATHIVFFGSHRKYITPLRMLFQEKGKTITIVSTAKTDTRVVPDVLRQLDNFVDLADKFFIKNIKSDDSTPRSFSGSMHPLITD